MSTVVSSLQVYRELAAIYERRGQAKLRDWFLVLSGDAALNLGEQEQAEGFRRRLLHVNPHHMLRPFASFAEALRSPEVEAYIADLRRRYPLETAEQLFRSAQKGPVEPSSCQDAVGSTASREVPPFHQAGGGYEFDEPTPKTRSVPKPRRVVPTVKSAPGIPRARKKNSSPSRFFAAPLAIPDWDLPPEDDNADRLSAFVSVLVFGITLLVAGGLAFWSVVAPFLSM